ncbi:hypothetical protein [uncultured Bosea sp.]|uniref:hypothetical protein n=1 Tax=uncultured Bosea sp. TaxID=211457 RepID=UPI0025EC57B2|nr:hypothetical protein [uncultured Bosea sp.]
MTSSCREAIRRIRPISGTLFGLVVLASIGSATAEAFRVLKGPEIRSLFTGMEFTDEVHWTLVLGRDGTLTNIGMGRKTVGRWQVKQDQLCLDRARDEQRCYVVSRSGKTYRLQEPDSDIYEEGIVQRPVARH